MSATGLSQFGEKPGLAARAAAVALLTGVVDRGKSLDALLDGPRSPVATLAPRDRALARAIVGATLRRLGTIRAILAELIPRSPGRAGALMRILETAAAQLLFMDVADHAAVALAMDQVSADRAAVHYKALANAVLRRIARERRTLAAGADPAVDTPAWLYQHWQRAYGEERARRIAQSHRRDPALDLSVKADPAGWAERLGGIVLPTGSVRLGASGPIDALSGYGEGAWWVQDAAAALPARLLGDVRGKHIADLCAAPGGKTAELANAGASVVAVDVAADRLGRLRDTLARLDLRAEVVQADILDWQPGEAFDAILLDAPCTATGTIRRHPDIPYLKRETDIAPLAALQARMIARAIGWLKPGGILVYATCSLEPEEGEAHLAPTLAALPTSVVPVRAEELPGLAAAITPEGTVRTLPYLLETDDPGTSGLDAFFMMRLAKR